MDKQAAGDNGNVAALAHDRALAQLEPRLFRVQIGVHVAAKPQVHGAVVVHGVFCRPAGGGSVRGDDDLHVRQGAHDGDVLGGVMARAVERVAHSAVGAAELDIQIRVAYLISRREQTQRGEKHREGVHKGDLSGGGETGSSGDHVEIGACTCIDRGAIDDTVIESNVIIDNLCQIAHNVHIGYGTAVAGGTTFAGSVTIGKYCIIGGTSVFNGHITICDGVTISGMCMVMRSIDKPGVYSSGIPAQTNKEWRITAARTLHINEMYHRLSSLEDKVEALVKNDNNQ